MIEVKNLTKRYGDLVANDDISLSVGPGDLTVLLGPEGAGKSTLIKSICGLLNVDGTVTINGYDNRSHEAKRLLGYVPDYPSLHPMLTVCEHLEFIARAYRLTEWKERADELMKRFDLYDNKDKLGKELSKVLQQKVSICSAVLTKPRVVIFDEPYLDLDLKAEKELRKLISELKQNDCALIISTNLADNIDENWDTVCIMIEGRIARICKRNEIKKDDDLKKIYSTIIGNKEKVFH